ncbi:MAG: hypothetical protein L6R48_25650, partial [Planctomycetes bacterium]|nr:hypothetical protein [Planctomycetota bacterium]
AQSLADWRARPGPGGATPELWMGEGGMWLDRAPSRLRLLGVPACGSDLAAAQALVRIAAGFKGLGVARHFHYALATSPAGSGNVLWRSECNSLVDFDGSARPAAAAHAALVWLLDEAAPVGAEALLVEGVQICLARFDHPAHGRITVAWSRAGIDPARVPGLLDQVREVRDLFGNPLPAAPRLSAAPVYLIAGKG